MSRRRVIAGRSAAGVTVALACVTALSACEPGARESGAEDDTVAARAASKRADGGRCRQAFDTAEFTPGGHRIDTAFEAPDTEWRIAKGALPFVPAY